MHLHPAIHATQNWVDRFIIAYRICPFARQEGLRYQLLEQDSLEQNLQALADELQYLQHHPHIQTTLLVFADSLQHFDEYLDALDLANQLLSDLGFEGEFQLASFHPHYQFDGEAIDDASHFTNRSPYPMWHIIRESSISEALQHFPNPENIPLRNIDLMRQHGTEHWAQLLQDCYHS